MVFPEPEFIFSDGQRIIVYWTDENPSDEFSILLNYEPIKKTFPIFYFLILLIPLSFVAFVVFKIYKNKETKIKTIGLGIYEKKIYDLLLEKGELKQKEIQEILDISKPRLSKLIRRLAERELIEIKPLGRTNIIKIKK